ncbi:MAG: hypothetical protein FJ267_19630, partial [Planctomycetes bacterium]|nr:hypothetical protein [Planctomycetota bacterium]
MQGWPVSDQSRKRRHFLNRSSVALRRTTCPPPHDTHWSRSFPTDSPPDRRRDHAHHRGLLPPLVRHFLTSVPFPFPALHLPPRQTHNHFGWDLSPFVSLKLDLSLVPFLFRLLFCLNRCRSYRGKQQRGQVQFLGLVWLTELSRSLGRHATLDDIPDAALDEFARQGFDWIWFLSVWQTGEFAQKISRSNAQWRHEFQQTLSDLTDDDIAGSGFAIKGYWGHTDLGGDAALARLRNRMKERGLKLMLDFVPNHMAPDHPWVEKHPDYFVRGSEIDLARS